MAILAPGETSDCSNPVLDVFLRKAGVLIDVISLERIIFDATGGSPVQIDPIAGREVVSVIDCPVGGRLGPGHYHTNYTVPTGATEGSYRTQWFFKQTALSQEYSFTEEWEVSSGAIAPTGDDVYATIQELRDEGVTVEQASDATLAAKLIFASRLIDKITGRFFNPRSMEVLLDGTGHGQLFLQQPIIALEELEISVEGISFTGNNLTDLEDVAVYNRAIRENLTRPDDRDNPRISFELADREHARLHSLFGRRVFFEGKQNVRVKGIFGYTDYDGSSLGKTPDLINHATKLLVIKNLAPLSDQDAHNEAQMAGNIRRYKTRDQEVEYQNRKAIGGLTEGPFTGDFEIDQILLMYCRPLDIAVI